MGDEEGRKVGAERSEGGGGEVDRLREVRCPWKIGNGLPGPDILLSCTFHVKCTVTVP